MSDVRQVTVQPSSQRLAVLFILATLALDAIGYGLIMPVMPDLLRSVTGGDLARAALWGGVLTGGFAVMQFLCGPVIGNLSDRFGRKPVLLGSLAVLTGDYIVLALAASVWLILAGRLVTGAASSTFGTASAYLADISSPQQRAQRFGLIGAAYGIGFVLGPALGGMLAQYGIRAPFVAAAVIAGANLLFGLLVVRETLAPRHRRPFEWRRANPFGTFRAIGRLSGLARFLVIYTAYEFAFTVYPVIWAYYAIARFDWTPGQVGLSLALYGVGFALVQGVLIRPALRALGRGGTIALGLVAAALSFAVLVWISNGVLALAMVPVSTLSGLVMPALRAEMTDRVAPSQQGELQGALASLHAFGMIAAPLIYTRVFALFTGAGAILDLPGMVFAVPSALSLAALLLLWRVRFERSAP